jgi:hypothetical protein
MAYRRRGLRVDVPLIPHQSQSIMEDACRHSSPPAYNYCTNSMREETQHAWDSQQNTSLVDRGQIFQVLHP